jgi:hypothetical protein
MVLADRFSRARGRPDEHGDKSAEDEGSDVIGFGRPNRFHNARRMEQTDEMGKEAGRGEASSCHVGVRETMGRSTVAEWPGAFPRGAATEWTRTMNADTSALAHGREGIITDVIPVKQVIVTGPVRKEGRSFTCPRRITPCFERRSKTWPTSIQRSCHHRPRERRPGLSASFDFRDECFLDAHVFLTVGEKALVARNRPAKVRSVGVSRRIKCELRDAFAMHRRLHNLHRWRGDRSSRTSFDVLTANTPSAFGFLRLRPAAMGHRTKTRERFLARKTHNGEKLKCLTRNTKTASKRVTNAWRHASIARRRVCTSPTSKRWFVASSWTEVAPTFARSRCARCRVARSSRSRFASSAPKYATPAARNAASTKWITARNVPRHAASAQRHAVQWLVRARTTEHGGSRRGPRQRREANVLAGMFFGRKPASCGRFRSRASFLQRESASPRRYDIFIPH